MRHTTDVTHHPLKLAFGGLIALAVAMGIGRFVYTPILPAMVEALGLTASQAGFIASANFAGYLLGALIAATPWLPGPRRFWLLAGLATSVATTLLTALPSTLFLLAAIRFIGGLASAFVLVFASAVILKRLAAASASALSSVHFAGVGAGIALSAAAVAALSALGQGWRAQWIATGALALIGMACVAALVPRDDEEQSARAADAPFALTKRLAALIAAYGLFGFGYVITATFIVALVRSTEAVRHLEPVVWIAFGLAAIPSVALWTKLGRRIGIFAAFAIACLVEAVGVAASVLMPNNFGIMLAAIFLGGTFMGITALGLVGAQGLSASDPRRVLALMTGAFGLGQMFGPTFAGWMADRTESFTLPSLLAAGALIVSAALSGFLDARKAEIERRG